MFLLHIVCDLIKHSERFNPKQAPIFSYDFLIQKYGNLFLDVTPYILYRLFYFSPDQSKIQSWESKQLTRTMLVAGFSDPYCLLGLVPAESEIRSLVYLSSGSGMLSREASLELQQDGGTAAASTVTVMAGTIGDSKTNTHSFVPVLSSQSIKCPRILTSYIKHKSLFKVLGYTCLCFQGNWDTFGFKYTCAYTEEINKDPTLGQIPKEYCLY